MFIYVFVFADIRHGLVIGCTLVVCVALAPVMWQMWIVFGSGNANFYFAVTLAYCVAQVNGRQSRVLSFCVTRS
jgi:phosphatidylinositol glycan class U